MFSVIIPVYNHSPYLANAVTSALRSRLASEILLVDDASRDGSARLAARLAASRPDRIRDLTRPGECNRGAHARLNQLVEASSEEWIAVLNSDDAMLPGRLEAVERLCRGGESSFVCGHLLVADHTGRVIGTKRGSLDPEFPFPADFDPRAMLERRTLPHLLANQNIVATTSNMIFRKALHRDIGGFRALRYVHDWDFALRASAGGRATYLPHFLTLYRMHPSNTIKADFSEVAREVRSFMGDFVDEHPEFEGDPLFMSALQGNRYLEVTRNSSATDPRCSRGW
jgi:glycosyltransferase involved in cell wall biosynthesis